MNEEGNENQSPEEWPGSLVGMEEIAAVWGTPMTGSIPTIGSVRQPLCLVGVGHRT